MGSFILYHFRFIKSMKKLTFILAVVALALSIVNLAITIKEVL
nr:MAG TPA: hypothetical protein [Caudoviricetes sp.]